LNVLSVLLIDDNREWLFAVKERFKTETKFRIIGEAFDGEQALQLISETKPDILITDIIMPVYDGVYLLGQMREKIPDYHPIIIVFSGLSSDLTIEIAMKLKTDYYFLKPVNLDSFMIVLKQLISVKHIGSEKQESNGFLNYDKIVSDLLTEIGIPFQMKGNEYLKRAIIMCLKDKENLNMLTKIVYGEIGKSFDTGASAVEKGIRYAISSAFKAKTKLFNSIFPSMPKHLPNGKFIAIICDYIIKDH